MGVTSGVRTRPQVSRENVKGFKVSAGARKKAELSIIVYKKPELVKYSTV